MGTRGKILSYYGNGKHRGSYKVLELTEENKKIIEKKMGLEFEDKTDYLHIGYDSIHQLQNENVKKEIELEEFFSLVDWSKYEHLEGSNVKKEIVVLGLMGYYNTSEDKYKELQELGNIKTKNISAKKYLVYNGSEYYFTKDNIDYDVYYNIDQFESFKAYIKDNSKPKNIVPKAFEKGKKYQVREWDDMAEEYGVENDHIKNRNKFPKANKRYCGKQFTSEEDAESFRVDTNAIFPEETYEVTNMTNSTSKINGYKTTNIFTDEAIPEPPKPSKPKVVKVGEKYYQGNKEVSLEDFAVEVEIDEKEVNEKRFVAAIELGIEYDNLEEKSKRIQDIIKNELDSPEAIADKEWVYIYGASGSGKTTEAIKYFKNKGQDYIKQAGFGQLTGDDLLGYKSITEGTYFRSLLRDAVEYGKGFILDEADACNPNTLLVLNELKGEYMQFPDKKVKIHEDFRFIATGNTIGFSEDYNGRSKMDRATTARFSMVEYNLTLLDIGERWGGSYTKRIKDLESKEPREIQREIRQMKQKEGKTNA